MEKDNFTHVGYKIESKWTKKTNKILIDTGNNMVVTRGEEGYGVDEKGIEDPVHDDKKRLNFRWWVDMEYKDDIL